MKTLLIFLIVMAIAASSACASRPSDWRSVSLRLQQGMNEDQAIAAIGHPPDSAEVVTCGVDRGSAWQCRRLSFNSSGADAQHALIVYEANYGGVWRVDSWTAL